jgi:CRP/FNR family transcriptional regulator
MAAIGCSTYPGEVVATRESELVVLPVESVRAALERHPELAREILYFYCQRIHHIETLFSLSREPAEKRLVAALLFLYGKFGFELPLTSAEIGATAGTAPETAMRKLKIFERRGWLRRSRGRVEIADLAALKAKLGAEFFFQ